MTIKERFLQLCDVQSTTTGEALENLVMKLLEENQLKVEDILVEKLYTFIANSTKRHAAFVETQKAIDPDYNTSFPGNINGFQRSPTERPGSAYTVVDGVLRRVQELRTDKQFTEIFMKATTAAEALDIEIPEQIPGQARRRKVPEKFKYSSTSAGEDHHVLTLEEYYRGKLYFTFLDILRQELERRFRGEGKNSSDILRSSRSH
ncbi:hypothetical protein F7725_007618 [Dissostichus mawsoni]|uniref:Uncharacterized protein n=1 Tax=Dissostichus mawsoni TaxID=36200 RepID=A0A7J5Y4W2_DISMA|nr:hypothetical protein F7725_007618 [Dissostichus mawsoni]